MSSSSDSEVEERFKEAVDMNLFTNSLFDTTKNDTEPNDSQSEKEKPKLSQRFLQTDEENLISELNVSESMQNFIGKKLSEILEKSTEFVEIKDIKKSKKKRVPINDAHADEEHDDDGNIMLLNGFPIVKMTEEVSTVPYPQVKIQIKRRKIKGEEEESQSSKIENSVIESSKINDFSFKNRHDPLEYRTKKNISYLIEKPNEFLKLKNKNNWNPEKIKRSKNFGKSLNRCIKK